MQTNLNAKEIQLVATIVRADGTREELGVIDAFYKNPLKQLIWNIKKWIKHLKNVLNVNKKNY